MTVMREDLKKAVKLVEGGMSYGEAARAIGGLTRNAVAGACDRAGLKTGRPTWAYTEVRKQRLSAILIAQWAVMSPLQRNRRQAGLTAGKQTQAFREKARAFAMRRQRDDGGRFLSP